MGLGVKWLVAEGRVWRSVRRECMAKSALLVLQHIFLRHQELSYWKQATISWPGCQGWAEKMYESRENCQKLKPKYIMEYWEHGDNKAAACTYNSQEYIKWNKSHKVMTLWYSFGNRCLGQETKRWIKATVD